MKLKNKRTGEIIAFNKGKIILDCNDGKTIYFNSLEDLEEWEEYEEPFSTSFYTIVDGEIKHCIFYRERVAGCPDDAWAYIKDDGRESINHLKAVGLYFETKEEAEKAVEKLKCFTNLKNHEFMFDGWYYGTDGNIVILANAHEFNDMEEQDLTKVFGEKIC